MAGPTRAGFLVDLVQASAGSATEWRPTWGSMDCVFMDFMDCFELIY